MMEDFFYGNADSGGDNVVLGCRGGVGVRRLFIGLVILLPFLLGSCGGGEKIPDVSNIQVEIQSRRLDRDLAALDTNKLVEGLRTLKGKYPDFLDFYLDTLMGFGVKGNYADTSQAIQLGLRGFLTQKDYKGVFDTVAKHFPDTKKEEAALVKGFQFMKYYYPD